MPKLPLEVRAKRYILEPLLSMCEMALPRLKAEIFLHSPGREELQGWTVRSLLFSEEQLQGAEVNAQYLLLLLWSKMFFRKPKPL